MPDIVINQGSLVHADVGSAADAADMNVGVPEISAAFDEQLLSKKRACRLRENQRATLQINMRDKLGNNLDLTGYGFASSSSSSSSSASDDGTIKVRFREASLVCPTVYEIGATVLSAEQGLISCDIPTQVMDRFGIWFAEAGALNADDDLLFTDEVYLYIEHSAWSSRPSSAVHGPPSIDDIRLAMRDNSPYENELIENYEYGVVEICHAAIRAINFWNEQPPIIAVARYSTFTFPFREIWTRGIKLFLFNMAEEHYRRNHFRHNAGGVSSDDKDRHREYNQAWKEEFSTYRQMVMHQKARINASQGFGSLGAGYGYGYGWR